MHILLLGLALLSLLLFLIAFFHVRNSKESFGFIYHWGILFGSFVWEDLLVFSLVTFFASILVNSMHDIRVGLLLLGIAWAVRSGGETLYFFLQQFHQPTHIPHAIGQHLQKMRPILGELSEQKYMIIMQVWWQTILTLSATSVILLLLYWKQLPVWL